MGHKLALLNLGSIAEQSLAGAISTATHGAGLKHGNISTLIHEITMVLADTSIVTCSKHKNPDLFYSSLCGLGAIGIFTRVKVQLCPLYQLQDEHFIQPLDSFLDQLDDSDGL